MADFDLDKIRRNADIVKIISSYLPLSREGKSMVGICPFHDDSSPSMFVSPEKQIFKCFACGKGGNVFTFVRDYEHIHFNEAVGKVAELSGQVIPGFKKIERVVNKTHLRLYNLLEEIANYYSYNLKNSSDTEAREYLASRISEENIVTDFKLGFSPKDRETSIKFLKAKGYTVDEILAAGIGVESNGNVYDLYGGRLVFPLFDQYGKVIAFSGRKLPSASKDEPKYVNTMETVLFHKTENIYNYHNAEKNCRRLGHVYLLEGYMDVIALARVGITNAIATMGTALTREQIGLIKRLNCELRLCFDNDPAGQNATYKALKMLKDANVNVRVVKSDKEEKDPDEILKKGSEYLKNYLNELWSPTDYRLAYLAKQVDTNNYEDKKKSIISFIEEIALENLTPLDEDYYFSRLQEITNFSLGAMKETYDRTKSKYGGQNTNASQVYQRRIPKKIKYKNKYQQAEEELILYMLQDNSIIERFQDKVGVIQHDIYRSIVKWIIHYYSKYGQVSCADLFSDENFQNNQNLGEALKDFDFERQLPSFSEKYFEILNIEFYLQEQINDLKRRINETLDNKEKFELAAQKSILAKKLNEMRKK